MSKFKVGDRVRVVTSCLDELGLAEGKVGTLVTIDSGKTWFPYLVEFDHIVKGLKPRLWCTKVELVEPEKHPVIVITTDGKTTTATKRLGKKVLATATARCAPDDAFHYDTGAALAFARLVGAEVKFTEAEVEEEEKPSYYNGKVVCVKSIAPWWTAGKIYTFQDGRVEDDYGGIGVHHFKSLEEFNDSAPNARRFIPLVED